MSSNNVIRIEVSKTLSNLAGNRFGREVFSEQIREKLKADEINEIVIPKEIKDIASSFVQGIYSEICEKYGKEKASTMMVLKSENDDVMKKIGDSIKTYGI